jgi:hypothetical protein
MVKKPEPSKPTTWNIYKIANKAVWLGTVEAPDEATAMENAAVELPGVVTLHHRAGRRYTHRLAAPRRLAVAD